MPALIDEPTFARAQELLEENKVRARRRTIEPSLVQGLVSCRNCGYALSRTSTRSSARKIHYYRCIGSDGWRHLAGPRCDNRPVRQDLLDQVVWTEVMRLLEDPTLIQQELDRRLAAAQAADPMKTRTQAVERDLVRVGKTIERLLTAYQEDLVSLEQLRERMPLLRQREHTLRTEMDALVKQTRDRAAQLRLAETLSVFLARVRVAADTLDIQERQRIVRLVVKEVLVGDDTIVIRHCIPVSSEPPPGGSGRPTGAADEVDEDRSYLLRTGSSTPPLRRTFFAPCPRPVLQHAGVQPFLDEPHDAPVRNPVLEELHQPPVVDGIEESPDVGIERPVHPPRQQPRVERVQRVVLAAPRSEPVREAAEVRLVDGVQHLARRALDDLVLQCGHAERPEPPIGLWDVHPPNRLRAVRPPLQPGGQVLEVGLQVLPVVPPRLAVHPWCRLPLETEVGRPEPGRIVDMVQERREPLLPVPSCCVAYPLQRAVHACPAQGPGRVVLPRVPFGQAPSLHPLRGRRSGLVRGLRRYYGPVRLPMSVHRRRGSLDFPTRPAAPSAAGEHRISRFSREVFPCVHGVSDRAGSCRVSRYRHSRCGLPLLLTASAPRREFLSRLNTRPARAPVNASPLPLPTTTHDSGSVWIATPSPYDSFIRNTSPV